MQSSRLDQSAQGDDLGVHPPNLSLNQQPQTFRLTYTQLINDDKLWTTSNSSLEQSSFGQAATKQGTRTKPISPVRQTDTSLIIKRHQVHFIEDPIQKLSSTGISRTESKQFTGGTGSTTANENSPVSIMKRKTRLPSHFLRTLQGPIEMLSPQQKQIVDTSNKAVFGAVMLRTTRNSSHQEWPRPGRYHPSYQTQTSFASAAVMPPKLKLKQPRKLESMTFSNGVLPGQDLEGHKPGKASLRASAQPLPANSTATLSPRGGPLAKPGSSIPDQQKPPSIAKKINNLKKKIAAFNNPRAFNPQHLLPLSPKYLSPRESHCTTTAVTSPRKQALDFYKSCDLTGLADLGESGNRPSEAEIRQSMTSILNQSTMSGFSNGNRNKKQNQSLAGSFNQSRNVAMQQERSTFVALTRRLDHLERLDSMETKDRLRVKFNNEFGIRVSEKTAFFTKVGKLESFMKQRAQIIERNRAATRLQRWFRRSRFRKVASIILKKVMSAIFKIQRWWRLRQSEKRRALLMVPAVPMIQRHLRGYLARRQYLKQICLMRMDALLSDFETKDRALKTNLQILLRYRWLRYKRAKAKAEEGQNSTNVKSAQRSARMSRRSNGLQFNKAGLAAKQLPQQTEEYLKKSGNFLASPKANSKPKGKASSARRLTIMPRPADFSSSQPS